MKTGTIRKKKLALQWEEEKGFDVAVRLQSAKATSASQPPTNVLVLSEKKAARVLSFAAAA